MPNTYSNPRMRATVDGWPSGNKRVTATFYIETTRRGQRAVRTTTGKPTKLTFAKEMRIVDGDDGRTYIAALSMYGHVTIHRGDMKHDEETVFPQEAGTGRDDPRYPALRALFFTPPTA